MQYIKRIAGGLLAATVTAAATPATALAQDHAEATQLRALIEAQNQEIAALKQRLNALEHDHASTNATSLSTDTGTAPSRDVATIGAAPAAATTTPSSVGTTIDWKNGVPNFSADDGSFSFRPRGRIQADTSSTDGSRFDSRNLTATEFRRMRLGFQGTFGKTNSYVMEADFADDKVLVSAAQLAHRTTLFGQEASLFAGYGRMERGMDGASNDAFVPFVERSAVYDGLMNASGSLAMGVGGTVTGKSWRVNANLVGDNLSDGTTSDNVALVARAHWNPLKHEDAIIHLGLSGYYEQIGGERTISMAQRVAGHVNDNLRVQSGDIIGADGSSNLNVEAGGVYHGLWFMGEHGQRDIRMEQGGDITHKATTLSAGWMLGGAKVPYSPKEGQWKVMDIREPVTAGGHGEFGLVTRWEKIDYSDQPTGGTSEASTLGMNWYMTRQVTLMLDLIHWKVQNAFGPYAGEDRGNSISTRLQFYF